METKGKENNNFNSKIFFRILLLVLSVALILQTSSAVGPIPDTKEVYPSWSPEGQKILFVSYGVMSEGVFLIKPDGSEIQEIRGGIEPSWSPDGNIIMIDIFNESRDIVLMDIETQNITRLTYNGNSLKEYEPKYSPDGKKIAFNGASKRTDVYIIDSSGANLQKIAENASSPEWSPDGKNIAYYTYDDVNEIWITHPDGTNKKKIFTDYRYSIVDRYRWTPDSKYLLLNNGSNIITKVDIDNPSDIEYIYDPVANWNPKYSPDGNFVTFVSSMDGGNPDLFVARSNGSDLYRLVYDTNPRVPNPPDYFGKISRPAPPSWPWPTPEPTATPAKTPVTSGFSLLAAFISLILSILIRKIER